MANKEKLDILIAHLENLPPEALDMNRFSSRGEKASCETPACVAGWTVTLFNPSLYEKDLQEDITLFIDSIPLHATYILDLTEKQADNLFFMKNYLNRLDNPITKEKVLKTLKHLREHDEVK